MSKLFINSLYGKFGMSPYKVDHVIVDSNQALDFYNNEFIDIQDVISLGDKELISCFEKVDHSNPKFKPDMNISLPIAIAVTSYARIHMSKMKLELLEKGVDVFYSDTDSLFIGKPLDSTLVGKDIGLMKLVGIFDEAVFAGPKAYRCINSQSEKKKN